MTLGWQFSSLTRGVAAAPQSVARLLKKPSRNLRWHFILVAASYAAAEEELARREDMIGPTETHSLLLGAQITEGCGFSDCRQMIGFPIDTDKLAESLKLSHRLSEEVFIFDHEHLSAIRILHPRFDMLRPVTGIKLGLGRDKFQKVVFHTIDHLAIVAIRRSLHHAVAQQINHPAKIRAREGVRLEEHRVRVAAIIFLVTKVWHKIMHQRAGRQTRIDPINYAAGKVLKPRIA
jgi:hypothetical protein